MRTVSEILDDMHEAMNHADIEGVQRCIDEANEIDSTAGMALVHNGRGWLAAFSGDYDSALFHFEAELLLHRDLENLNGEAATIANIGNVLVSRGMWSNALEHFRRAFELYESIEYRDGMARMLSSMATVFNRTGDFPKSLEHNRKALQIHIEDGTLHGQAQVLGNIGNIYSMMGNYPEALDHMMRSLDLHQSLNDPVRAATVMGNIGTVHGGSGDIDRAIEYLQRALEIQTSLGNANAIAGLCSNLGYGYLQRGDHEQALGYLTRALSYYKEQSNTQGEVAVVSMMIDAYLDTGNISEARDLLYTVDLIKVDEPDVAIHRLDSRGRLALLERDTDTAKLHYIEALTLAEQHELRYAQAEMHKALREICQQLNDFSGYIDHNNAYTRIIEEINGRETAAKLATLEAERKMTKERSEHEKHLAILHSTLPPHIADRVARGEVVNDHYTDAAVMFLDIVGFTTNTSHLPPNDVVTMLDDIFSTIDHICDIHGVVKVKTIGDSYMCYRGDTDATSNARSIAHVALDVMKAAFTWPNGEPVQFRVGIHIGAATAGVIGTQRLQYDVWGDTVNVASRMESTGEPARIHVSSSFALALDQRLQHPRLLEPRLGETDVIPSDSEEQNITSQFPVPYSLRERGALEIKGKGMMTTYWLE